MQVDRHTLLCTGLLQVVSKNGCKKPDFNTPDLLQGSRNAADVLGVTGLMKTCLRKSDLMQLDICIQRTCIELGDKKSWQSTCIKFVDNMHQVC